MAEKVDGCMLWANMHLLFWLSLIPFGTNWVSEHHDMPLPVAFYGLLLLMSAIAYFILQNSIIRSQGEGSLLATAVGGNLNGKE